MALIALLITGCGGASGKQAKPAAASAGAGADQGAAKTRDRAAGPSARDARMPGALPVEAEAWEPPNPTPEALAATSDAQDEPPEYTAIKTRLLHGESGAHAVKPLQTLSHKYAKNADISFLLGQVYLEKLWVDDGLKALRHAMQLDPALRANPYLIRAVIGGLGNDSDAAKVRRFLAQDIGAPAVPYLQEVLLGDWRQQVKERAQSVLDDIP